MSDRTFPLILGAGAAAAYFWFRSKKRAEASPLPASADPWATSPPLPSTTQPTKPPTPTPTQLPGRWVWPVPKFNGRLPVVSSGWTSPRKGGPHGGVDIMYKRVPADPYKAGTPNGTKGYVMPERMPALAASDGVVWSAGWTPKGFHVVIDHGPRKVATFYTHMTELFVAPTARAKSGQRVVAGQPLGIIGESPEDSEHIKHLHFSVWLGGPSDAVDPEPIMKGWEFLDPPKLPAPTPQPTAQPAVATAPPQPQPQPQPAPTPKPTQQPAPQGKPAMPPPKPAPAPTKQGPTVIARNASLTYRTIGRRGEPYPQWIRALNGKSGVYVIRELSADGSAEIVYVGSSTGRLYDTLTRHFQTVRHEAQEVPMT